MRNYIRLFLSLFLLTMTHLGGCSVQSDSDRQDEPILSPPGNVSKGVLAAGVRVLSSAENAALISQTDTQLRYRGNMLLRDGEVVLGESVVYKVLAVARVGDETIVTATSPTVEEVFDSLTIRGEFDAAEEIVSVALPVNGRKTAQSATFGADIKLSDALSVGAVSAVVSVEGKINGTFDYEFDKVAGGLKSALLEFNSKVNASSAIDIAASLADSKEKLIYARRFPIPVSIYDSVFNLIGVRVASIYAPFYLGVEGEASFNMGLQRTASIDGGLRISYSPSMSLTQSITFEGDDSQTAPSFSPVIAEGRYSASFGVYLRGAPALAFLNKVALAGISTKSTARGTAELSVNGLNDDYCLKSNPSLQVSANGYFKTIGADLKTEEISRPLWTGEELIYGNCRLQPEVHIDTTITSLGLPTLLTATVVAPQEVPAGTLPPTGTIKFLIGGGDVLCVADFSANEIASCTGVITRMPSQLSASYGGDEVWSPASSGTINIDKIPKRYTN